MAGIELTDKELRLAKANVAYALENCPVEGGIMTEDGHRSTQESFKALLEKLKAEDVKAVNKLKLNEDELNFLAAAASYASEYCPVEGGIMTEDGQFSTTADFAALREKLGSFQSRLRDTI